MRRIEKHPDVDDTAEARVTIASPSAEAVLRQYEDTLPEWMICSDVVVIRGADEKWIEVEPTEHDKCERCWRHRSSVEVRTDVEGDLLCDRCHGVLTERLSAPLE